MVYVKLIMYILLQDSYIYIHQKKALFSIIHIINDMIKIQIRMPI